jgi:NADH-quinone oxidoreductase subunit L
MGTNLILAIVLCLSAVAGPKHSGVILSAVAGPKHSGVILSTVAGPKRSGVILSTVAGFKRSGVILSTVAGPKRSGVILSAAEGSLFNLAWLIPVFPFLAFILIALGGHRVRRGRFSRTVALVGIAAAFVLSQGVFWKAVTLDSHRFALTLSPWLPIGGVTMNLGLYLDPISVMMLFMVPLVCGMIFVYSVGYMRGDPHLSRFFAYISLFAAAMLALTVFDSFLTLFIFWEIMGTCSYLLIGFWSERDAAFKAGLKAFLVTKVGDLFFMLGLALLYAEVGSLTYRDVFAPQTLQALAHKPFMDMQVSTATVISLLIFGGTMGKSAQFPLHTWLPDAMEGPTPVSALIHAATMVSAGVYLIVRAFPLFAMAEAMGFVAFIGTFTALFASVIALAQMDIKRVLAFSTISQLGYMVAAVGIGAWVAAMFHLITHAFFKALLFLASGSVIHGMEHALSAGGQAELNPNDMRRMGDLGRRMPRTAVAFLIGGLSLAGFPLVTAGFWSKDEILTQAWHSNVLVFWMLGLAAGLTAFYTARQLCLTFLGAPRTAAAAQVSESTPWMTWPLLGLALFAVILGWMGIPEDFPLIGGLIPNWFHHFVAQAAADTHHPSAGEAPGLPLMLGMAFAVGGLGLGWMVYGRNPLAAGAMDPLEVGLRKLNLGWVYRAMRHRFYMDEAYARLFVTPSIGLGDVFAWFDQHIIDRAIRYLARVGCGLSEGSGEFDSLCIDALVNAVGRGGRGSAWIAGWFDLYVVDFAVNVLAWLGQVVAKLSGLFDQQIVDGIVGTVAEFIWWVGGQVRRIQIGLVQDYLWNALFMIVLLVAVIVLL